MTSTPEEAKESLPAQRDRKRRRQTIKQGTNAQNVTAKKQVRKTNQNTQFNASFGPGISKMSVDSVAYVNFENDVLLARGLFWHNTCGTTPESENTLHTGHWRTRGFDQLRRDVRASKSWKEKKQG